MSSRFWRRACQLAVLILFFWLFRSTEDPGNPEALGVLGLTNGLFRLDPLVTVVLAATGHLIWQVVLPGVLVLLSVLILARWFCGWFCPLGTLIDLSDRLLGPMARWTRRWTDSPVVRAKPWVQGLRRGKYVVLILVVLTAFFGLPLIGWVDPFALLTRGLALGVDPLLAGAAGPVSSWLLDHTPAWFSATISEPAYAFAQAHLLPTRTIAMQFAGISLALLAGVLALELVQRRFWCRNLCPTGALFGLTARFSWLKRLPVKACGTCTSCTTECRMASFDQHLRFQPEGCTLCLDCAGDCPKGVARFSLTGPAAKPQTTPKVTPKTAPAEISRRAFLVAAGGGALAPVLAGAVPGLKSPALLPPRCLRPPGVAGGPFEPPPAHLGTTLALDQQTGDPKEPPPFLDLLPAPNNPEAQAKAQARDRDFLDRCVRCGECLKVCPTGALQADGLAVGLGGVFAPVLIPTIGYCEHTCTLCAQVCPTGAIPLTDLASKQKAVIGRAVFDRSRCLPHARHEECLVCEEHCPIPNKAIRLDNVEALVDGKRKILGLPRVEAELCIGCGICESKCPLEGERGVRVVRA